MAAPVRSGPRDDAESPGSPEGLSLLTDVAGQKRAAAEAAALGVESGMVLGLGTGSTITYFLEALGRRLEGGDLADIRGVPTSVRTADASRRLGIPVTDLATDPVLDLAVDGADEVDPELRLIKGLGGALLREKVVAQATKRLVIIVDEGKLVDRLGSRSPLPVEVVPFAEAPIRRYAESLGADVTVRESEPGVPYRTDNGNLVLDCALQGGIEAPESLNDDLRARAGVVETGFFLGMTDLVVVGASDGVRTLARAAGAGARG